MNTGSRSETVGILPVGALGVGLFYHLTRLLKEIDSSICFVERSGAQNTWAQASGAELSISCHGSIRTLPLAQINRPGLLACAERDCLPTILLVCTQSDQILSVIKNFVELLERLFTAEGLESALTRLPIVVLCSNGIYHQRVRRFLVETLEESTLYGRLPDLWSEPMSLIVGKLLRGVTMQTAQRQGHGAEAIYVPGPAGLTRIAGGSPADRRSCSEVLHRHGGEFELVDDHSATRVEFDKALVNLFANFLGQFKAIDEQGCFRLVRVCDIYPDKVSAETRELASHVVAIGRAVKAYGSDDDFEMIYQKALSVMIGAWEHVPSSIRWIEEHLNAGTLRPQITPTEKWLVDPLIQYASAAGLEPSARYFQDLVRQVEARFALAIEVRGKSPANGYRSGANTTA